MSEDRIDELLRSVRVRQQQIRELMAELEQRGREIRAEAKRLIKETLEKSEETQKNAGGKDVERIIKEFERRGLD